MKNKTLIIVLIIIMSIMIFILTMFLVSYLKGNFNFKDGIFNIGSKSTNIIYDKKFDIEELHNISIKQNAGDIIIRESPDNDIQVVAYGDNQSELKVNTNNNDLNIDYTKRFRISFLGFNQKLNDIIIYVPANYSNKINIKNDYGKCEIADLKNATVDIDCDAGNVEVGKIKNATIKCDYGNIEVGEILNRCELKADCGNINVDTMSIKENSTIKADLGNIEIENVDDIYIDAEVDLGKCNINQNNRQSNVTLKIKCDCGNVTVK